MTSTGTVLLDANVLIALTVVEHEHHDRASAWMASVERFAVCPVVQGALVRFLVRLGEDPTAVNAVVRAVGDLDRGEFWADDVSYADVELGRVRGHRQMTDAYLVALAAAHGGVLGTLDVALAASHPEATVLVPPEGVIG